MRSIVVTAVCTAVILSNPRIASSQQYYVVVGAFAANESASEFKGFLPEQFIDTSYSVTGNDQLLHFYILRTSDREHAIAKALQLREAIKSAPEQLIGDHPEGILSGVLISNNADEQASASTAERSSASGAAAGPAAATGSPPPNPVGRYFRFSVETPEGYPITAQLHQVDLENGRALASYRANEFVDLSRPGASRKPMAVVCGVFGYKEAFQYVDYFNPARNVREAYVDDDGAWVIPYKLERVETGDVSPMHNVSFYKDAAIMTTTSSVDLDELVNMMHMNPYYEIIIHAHCNGKNNRQIAAPGDDRKYFDVDNAVIINGTARDLTTLRAEAIRGYLEDHGVDPARVQIFSWGASDMLVKTDDPDASVNDRIEIEFTRD